MFFIKNMKREITISILIIFVLLISSACNGNTSTVAKDKNAKKLNLLILKNSSANSKQINEQVLKAIKSFKSDVDIRIEFSEQITNIEGAQKALNRFVKSNPDYIIATDTQYSKMIEISAKENPKIRFAILEGDIPVIDENSNLVSYKFSYYQMGYLTGFIASKVTQNEKVLYIGGNKDKMRYAFERGALNGLQKDSSRYRLDVEYMSSSPSGFENTDLTKSTANKYYAMNYDLIIQNTGLASKGIFDAAIKNQKFVIGSEFDQTTEVGDYAKKIFYTSVIKKYDNATSEALKNLIAEKFIAGNIYLGCKENAIDYTVNDANKKIESFKDEIEALKTTMKNDENKFGKDKE